MNSGLLENILECYKGFEKPSPIQSQAWPFLLDSHDLIGIAATGSVMHILKKRKSKAPKGRNPLCLMLSPTRELAQQDAGVHALSNVCHVNIE
ncbi:hypothetical protein RJT34_02683 [Clitoria ternatea]|uniref:DEAD/DEAH-box helicase domain-containing protein n=1 Tax=Clitoria ternatea TaxID=43366 RepID=A0AAN9KID3_CLITE